MALDTTSFHLQEEWGNVPQDVMQLLINSMCIKCQACIDTDGGHMLLSTEHCSPQSVIFICGAPRFCFIKSSKTLNLTFLHMALFGNGLFMQTKKIPLHNKSIGNNFSYNILLEFSIQLIDFNVNMDSLCFLKKNIDTAKW